MSWSYTSLPKAPSWRVQGQLSFFNFPLLATVNKDIEILVNCEVKIA
jgi:hypothetical protein